MAEERKTYAKGEWDVELKRLAAELHYKLAELSNEDSSIALIHEYLKSTTFESYKNGARAGAYHAKQKQKTAV